MKTKTKEVFAVWTNTDLTEGRGREVVLAFCEVEATANRLVKGSYVMGSDGRITKEKFIFKDEIWWAPHATLVYPTDEDKHLQKLIEMERNFTIKREAVIAKVKALGLTNEDIEILRTMKP